MHYRLFLIFKMVLDLFGMNKTIQCVKNISLLLKKELQIILYKRLWLILMVLQRVFFYKHIVCHFIFQFYLSLPIPSLYKKQISRVRLASHNLAVESGRPNDICRGERVCEFCKSSIQDEFHFVIICPLYNDLRMKYLKNY